MAQTHATSPISRGRRQLQNRQIQTFGLQGTLQTIFLEHENDTFNRKGEFGDARYIFSFYCEMSHI